MNSSEADLFADWEKRDRPFPWTKDQFSAAESSVVVLDQEGAKGFAILQLVGEEAYLQNFLIHPDYRRQGRGRQLLKNLSALLKASGANRLFLDVQVNNQDAIHLYEKLGFNIVQIRPRSYPNGEGGFLMEKDL